MEFALWLNKPTKCGYNNNGRHPSYVEEENPNYLTLSRYLNGFGPLQIGGVESELEYPTIQYTGFRGCIRNIYDNGDMYDLYSPPKEVNAPRGCELAGPCPDCNDHGYCEPKWNVPSICVCDLGFSGINCNGSKCSNHVTFFCLANTVLCYATLLCAMLVLLLIGAMHAVSGSFSLSLFVVMPMVLI